MHTAHDKVRDKKTQAEVCYTCHKEQRTQEHKISHHPIGEGKVACSDCHNSHGSAGPKLLKKNTVNETCYTCHAEKRGPFLWEHQPVSEDCTTCHTPHGSNISPLLKSRAPFLCSECHDGPHASKSPAGPNVAGWQGGLKQSGTTATGLPSESYAGRACQNCHSMVHGSNHPAGALLHR
jgi:DmsE family decaheme c-type cytochrome